MPFKHNEPHRDHIPGARYKVTNWAEYERWLVRRGDLRFWISDDVLEGWIARYRTTPGGQRKFSNIAIEATPILGAAFKLPLRQTEGFVRCLMGLLGLELPVPDHSTLVRRRRTVAVDLHAPGRSGPVDLVLDPTGLKFFSPGEWARKKHGEKHRSWRKLHIGVYARTGEILAHVLTDDDTSDQAVAGDLVASAGGRIRTVIAPSRRLQAIACRSVDGAYDGEPTYEAIRGTRPAASSPKIVIPPHRPSIPEAGATCSGSERERHALRIAEVGRMAWQKETGYGLRSIVEAAVFRLKQILRSRLTARSFGAQIAEINLGSGPIDLVAVVALGCFKLLNFRSCDEQLVLVDR